MVRGMTEGFSYDNFQSETVRQAKADGILPQSPPPEDRNTDRVKTRKKAAKNRSKETVVSAEQATGMWRNSTVDTASETVAMKGFDYLR